MATPSGTIGLSDVNIELGFAGTTLITMNQANVRTLADVGGSGTPISMQNLQNKSNRVTASATISSDTANYVLNTAKAPGYSVGKTDMTLTINPSINVRSSSTGSYALTVDTSWTTGDTVIVVNNGIIVGGGGNGGSGGNGFSFSLGTPGGVGGPALLVQRAITLNNLNRIAGGGGGGGGGNAGQIPFGKGTKDTGGGGGGGGVSFGAGGSGGRSNDDTTNGNPGGAASVNTAGGGGSSEGTPSPNGGSGGGYASSGGQGGRGTLGPPGGSGGGAGAAIVGNSNITYINTGTINGSIS